jgi:hypothetical protein
VLIRMCIVLYIMVFRSADLGEALNAVSESPKTRNSTVACNCEATRACFALSSLWTFADSIQSFP